ncbi:uncharacterized protein LOC111033649 isoform X2 [Myzus persicae]|nr:uncharacterized protein LOC111033649 isoform X2 [Myzus persicae]
MTYGLETETDILIHALKPLHGDCNVFTRLLPKLNIVQHPHSAAVYLHLYTSVCIAFIVDYI